MMSKKERAEFESWKKRALAAEEKLGTLKTFSLLVFENIESEVRAIAEEAADDARCHCS